MPNRKPAAKMGPELLSTKGAAIPSSAPARTPEPFDETEGAPEGLAPIGHSRMSHAGRSFNVSVRVDEKRYRLLKKLGALNLTTNQAIMVAALDEYLKRHADKL